MRLSFVIAGLTGLAVMANSANAQIRRMPFKFVDIAGDRGIAPNTSDKHGNGVAAADVDNDGDTDLFFPHKDGTACRFLVNQGDGTFIDQAAAAGLDDTSGVRLGVWFDYTGDGRLDLLTVNETSATTSFKIYRQQAGLVFTDSTSFAGLEILDVGFNRAGIDVADINNDGFLDFYAAMWDNGGTALGYMFLNDGDSTFTDVSVSSGVRTSIANTQWQPTFYDFNGDGWMDLYQAVDFDENRLWMNDGDGTFTDISIAANANNSMNDMGMALGDYNHDGKMDIFVTNIFNGPEHNILMRNDTVGSTVSFTEVSESLGIEDGGWGWGCTFFDADLDGYIDLAATNGFGANIDSTRFYMNRGSGPKWFTRDLAKQAGIQDFDWGVSLISVDFDRDGDLDLLQTTNAAGGTIRLWDNQPLDNSLPMGNHIVIQPRQTGTNTRGIGSVVNLSTSFNNQMRHIGVGSSYMAQIPAEAHFGLGDETTVDFDVTFADGSTVSLAGIPAGGVMQVAPGPVTDMRQAGNTWRTRGDILSLETSDDDRLWLRSASVSSAEIGFDIDTGSTTFDATFEGGRSGADLAANLQAYNWNTGEFDDLGTWAMTGFDTTNTVTGIDTADYMNGDGRVLLRARGHRPAGDNLALPGSQVTLVIDHVSVTGNP